MVSENAVNGWPERAKAGGRAVVDPNVLTVAGDDVTSVGSSGPKRINWPNPKSTPTN